MDATDLPFFMGLPPGPHLRAPSTALSALFRSFAILHTLILPVCRSLESLTVTLFSALSILGTAHALAGIAVLRLAA
ncbi:hypothetical protein J3E69DRAFT_335317 [Trichoderma sp. SZMC 28015]